MTYHQNLGILFNPTYKNSACVTVTAGERESNLVHNFNTAIREVIKRIVGFF